MAQRKRTYNDLRNTTQKTKDEQYKHNKKVGMNSGTPEI